jgi:5-methylcytosine-specific restriction endonuclease McrA
MAPKVTCICGTCRKCKHREYMRAYYHQPRTSSFTSGGNVEVPCARCGKSVVRTVRKLAWKNGKAYCSSACKDKAKNALLKQALEQSKPDRWCRHCGVFMPKRMRSDAAYCSAKCNSAAHQQTRKASSRMGARQERIDRAYIIKRDAGRCHICGKTPKGAHLTIDHVIALARGGTHTSENLRVACLSCNCAKRDR